MRIKNFLNTIFMSIPLLFIAFPAFSQDLDINLIDKALGRNGITVTAVHSHMLEESPRLLYLHFWAVGEPVKLASALKEAQEKTNADIR